MVLSRSRSNNIQGLLLASGTFEDLETNLKLLKSIPEGKTTIGIHPCHATSFPSSEDDFINKCS